MFQYELTFGKSVGKLAALARSHRLFVPGWTMTLLYSTWADFPETIMYNDRMVLAYHNGVPIAASTYTVADKMVMVFVRKKHRRKKLGSTLINLITTSLDEYEYDYGNTASIKFWQYYDSGKNTRECSSSTDECIPLTQPPQLVNSMNENTDMHNELVSAEPPEMELNECKQELNASGSFVIIQCGSDVWVAEQDTHNFIAGYWPANSTGIAKATEVMQNISNQ